MKVDFPPTFDIEYYRRVYPEFLGLPDEIVIEHYRRYAEEQGRTTCIYDRSEYLKLFLNDAIAKNSLKVLEIGPFNNPFFVGDNVKYFDVLDTETIRERARKVSPKFEGVPPKIHYVEPNGDMSIIKEKFDIVFSSHVIEHQPDLVRHLQNVGNILNDGGMYILVIPDKRYCFDHYRNETKFFEVIDAYVNENKSHTFKSVAESNCFRAHNNSFLHWIGVHGSNELKLKEFTDMLETYAQGVKHRKYVNAHAWCFTPKVFNGIIEGLNKLNLINLKVHRLCHTIWGRFEFCCILERFD
ncbi:MAG: class I SAM-dependent methyltransferase [Selenomonadaceae bacterium]|nr:class I SAM-dependent methyltransferase [Selenomonadaceae bacterium]